MKTSPKGVYRFERAPGVIGVRSRLIGSVSHVGPQKWFAVAADKQRRWRVLGWARSRGRAVRLVQLEENARLKRERAT